MSVPSRPGPLGALVSGHGTRFRVFCTTTEHCAVRLFSPEGTVLATVALDPAGDGVFEAELADVRPGVLYKFVVGDRELPDPYARDLPLGVHGPARVCEPWPAAARIGATRPLREHVFYELHVGTFTPEGTFQAAQERLPHLVSLGVTALELMPVSSFAGRRGWGYDGVAHFAPHAPYGTREQLRALVEAAHRHGLSVFLDVVYNHFGPSGNYLSAYSPLYFSDRFRNAWGEAPNYEHWAVRRYVLDNARYWTEEFGFDGLRLDATHAILDPSPRHLLRELADAMAELEPRPLLVAEDERNEPSLVLEHGLDAVWADDFHHQLRVTLTGERDGYYAAYQPGVEALAEAIRGGWLYRGEVYPPTGRPRGKPADGLPPESFVYCLQNHDQVGNRAQGDRLTARLPLDAYAAVSMLLLFLPMTPLLFMGQEWAASSPFQYFTDHEPELGRAISTGRRREFAHFREFADADGAASIPDPQAPETFLRSKLRWDERAGEGHARVLELYRRLLELRRSDAVLAAAVGREALEATAHGPVLVVQRRAGGASRWLFLNLGTDGVPWCELPVPPGSGLLLHSDGRIDLGETLDRFSAAILAG